MSTEKLLRRQSDDDTWRFSADMYERRTDGETAASAVSNITTNIHLKLGLITTLWCVVMLVLIYTSHPFVLVAPLIIGLYHSFYIIWPENTSTKHLVTPLWCQLQTDTLSEQMGITPPKFAIDITGQTQYIHVTSGKDVETNRRLIISSQEILGMLRPSEIRAVIAHELAHVKFNDLLLNRFLSFIGSSLLFAIVIGMLFVTHDLLFVLVDTGTWTEPVTSGIIILITGFVVMSVITAISVNIWHLKEHRADLFSVQHTDGSELYNSLATVKSHYDLQSTRMKPDFLNRLRLIRKYTASIEDEKAYTNEKDT